MGGNWTSRTFLGCIRRSTNAGTDDADADDADDDDEYTPMDRCNDKCYEDDGLGQRADRADTITGVRQGVETGGDAKVRW